MDAFVLGAAGAAVAIGLAYILSRGTRRARRADRREARGSAPDAGEDASPEEGGGRTADEEEALPEDEPVEIPIDGTLDLHTFSPKEVGSLVSEYLDACRDRGILEVRVIHGKGKGVLRRTVWAALERHPAVEDYGLAGQGGGSWGATNVRLRPAEEEGASSEGA